MLRRPWQACGRLAVLLSSRPCNNISLSTIVEDMTTIVDDFGLKLADRLRRERDIRGWSLADLAERSGVARATISKIERAEASPTAAILVRLSAAFGLTMAGLM